MYFEYGTKTNVFYDEERTPAISQEYSGRKRVVENRQIALPIPKKPKINLKLQGKYKKTSNATQKTSLKLKTKSAMKTKAPVDEPKNELPDDDVPNDDVANDVALKIKAYVEPRQQRLANRNLVLKNVDTVVLEDKNSKDISTKKVKIYFYATYKI